MIILVKISLPNFIDIPPLGLLYVGDALQKAGYEVEVLHISTEDICKYSKKIIEKNPLFVGFSVFTGETMREYAKMSHDIKDTSNIPVVWGNAHPSLIPKQCLEESYIDFVVIGEGEVTSVELAEAIEGKKKISEVKGIGYKENGIININERRPFIKNLDKHRINWDLVDIRRYIGPIAGIKRCLRLVTSRGCPYYCGFCYNLDFNRRRWRAHSADSMVSQILLLKDEYDIQGVFFYDDNFFVNKKRAFEIVERIKMPYFCDLRLDWINEEYARKLNKTQCRFLLAGMESGSDRILKMINKGVSVSQVKRAVGALAKYPNIRVSGSLIFAYPTETFDEYKSTIRLIVDLFDIKRDIQFTTGFYIPYPGTDLYELAISEGFKPPAKTEDWAELDRWADKHEIKWVDWISSFEISRIRDNIQFLGKLNVYNIPILKGIVKRHILAYNGKLDGLGMKFLMWMYKAIYNDKYFFFVFIRRIIVAIFWKTREIQTRMNIIKK